MKRICKLCENEFETKSSRRSICYEDHYHKCPVCQKDVLTTDLYHRDTCCSKECSRKLANAVMKVKYDKHPATSEESKEKRRKTMIAKYGVDNLFKSKEFQESVKEENIKRLENWKHEKDIYENICRICENKFQTSVRTKTVCQNCETGTCEICGKLFTKQWPYTQTTCSEECRMKAWRSKGMNPRICKLCGKQFVPSSPRQKYCQGPHYRTCVICGKQFEHTKYIDNSTHTCSIKCANKLRENTNLQRYGSYNVMKLDEFVNKMKQTMLNKYGSPYFMLTDNFEQKYHETILEKYGVKWPIQNLEIKRKITSTIQNKYGVPWYVMSDEYQELQHNAIVSSLNRTFGDKLAEYTIPYKFEHRIHNRSYDIDITNTNILVELDPTYTHNTIGNHWSKVGLDKDYHKTKSQLAKENGCRCIHVFDWDNWEDIIHQIIPPKKYVDEYKCKPVFKQFKSQTNLATGEAYGEAIIDLCYEGNPIQEMKFVMKHPNTNWIIEYMKRRSDEVYCKEGYKLIFHCFLANLSNNVDAYCDLAKEDEEEYEKLGMKLVDIINPVKIWSKGTETKESHFGDDEQMLKEGWLPVYNCGYAHYKYERF